MTTTRFGLPVELAELAGEYDFAGELGRGGNAIVYEARDRVLGRAVAIKVVHPRPTSADDDPVARLAREARTVAQLDHPGIVAVYAVHGLRSGGLALVMPLVPGATLKATITRDGPLPVRRVETVLRDVAAALAYAHTRHLVHRDVKPENIFINAESGRALLADFGIARSTAADALTLTGTAIGTPFYMSPEQIDGIAVDGRSDLYSLGLVAWEMLTGARPWDGESLYQVIYKQKHDTLPPIEAFRSDVPRRLQYIVERMLQKKPAARWAGADGLLAQLDRTILPSDYAQWQVALPQRVARHRAAAALILRSATATRADTGVISAATMQFATATGMSSSATSAAPPSVAPGLAHTLTGIPVGGHAVDAVEEHASAAVGAPNLGSPESESLEPASTEQASMQPRLDVRPDEQALVPRLATEPMSQAYDTAEPVWLEEVRSDDAPSHLHAAGRRRRTLLLGGASLAAGGLVGVGALLVRGADGWSGAHLPVVFTAQAMARSVLATPAAQSTRESSAKPSAVIGRESTNAASPAAPSDAAGPSLRSPDMRIAVGAHHGCRLTPTYGAECWTLAAAEPVPAPANAVEVEGWMPARAGELRAVPGVMRYTALAAGSAHTCGVTPEGDIYCWGANDVGQLGDGTRVSRTAPVRVAGPASYRAVRGGRAHTCGLETGGAVRCWGENRSGQLGDGTLTSEPVPTAVVGLPALAVAVATGAQHSCALLGDGRVFCWGANRDGQLGVPGRTERSEPREVAGVRATAIGAGDAHTCAALTTGGVRCWGRDAAGQLGVGPLSTHASDIAPGRLTTVPDADHVTSLAGGASQSCAMTPSGAVWCWGGAGRASRVPVRIAMAGSVSFSAGADETCTIGSDDHPTCWVQARSVGERQSVGGSTPQPVASRMHGSRPHSPAHRLRTRH